MFWRLLRRQNAYYWQVLCPISRLESFHHTRIKLVEHNRLSSSLIHNTSNGEVSEQKSTESLDDERISKSEQTKSSYLPQSTFDDAKLKEIIETSNMSAARQIERQRQEQQREFENTVNSENLKVIERSVSSTAKSSDIGSSVAKSKLEAESLKAPDLTKLKSEQVSDREVSKEASKLYSNSSNADSHPIDESETQVLSKKSKSLDFKAIQKSLLDQYHQQQALLQKWGQEKWSNTQDSLRTIAKSLNDATGYSGIEKHKIQVEEVEHEIEQARESVRKAKAKYEHAIQCRSDSQKEINELLTRKHTWSPVDVERFTELYKNDHRNQHAEVSSKSALDEAEQNVEAVQIKLTASILTRYHEEQLWSDKIRQASTWGTWMLMGVNIMLFATATFFVEPWKRRKLVNAFQEEVQSKMEEYSTELKSLSQKLATESVELESSKEGTRNVTETTDNSGNLHKITFFGIDSWDTLREWAFSFSSAIRNPGHIDFSLAKQDFVIYSGLMAAIGWIFGSLLNLVILGR